MASSANQIFIFFLLITLLSSLQIHARESHFFNKIPSTNNVVVDNKEQSTTVIPQQQEPSFSPENETGGYGLYGHESGQLPPSATTPTTVHGQQPLTTTTKNVEDVPYKKYLPKNYNPVAYVTVPEDNNDDNTKFMDKEIAGAGAGADNRQNYGGGNYYNHQESRLPDDTRFMDKDFTTTTTTPAADNRQYNYNGDAGKSRMPDDTRFMDKDFTTTFAADNHRNYYTGAGESRMPDDTRFMDKDFTTPTTTSAADNRQFYGGGNYYNHQESRMPDETRFMENDFTTTPTTTFTADNRRNYYNGAGESRMPDDTRFMENDFTTTTAADNRHYHNGGGNNYFNNQESSMPEDKFTEQSSYTTTPTNTDNYNNQEETYPTTAYGDAAAGNNGFNYNTENRAQKQGMSDTRFLENGRYYYDVNTEKYVKNPYENSRNEFNNNNNNEFNNNFMENNNYQKFEEFQDQDDMP